MDIKAHIKRHQVAYSFGAGVVVMGVTVALLRRPIMINNMNLPVFNNMNSVNMGGHMRKIVRCIETDELWSSVSKAAEAAGSSISMMSQHLNGHKDQVNSLHYVIEGLASG